MCARARSTPVAACQRVGDADRPDGDGDDDDEEEDEDEDDDDDDDGGSPPWKSRL